MTEVTPVFKAKHLGVEPSDKRVTVWGSTLKVDPAYRMKMVRAPKRTVVESEDYGRVREAARHRSGGRCEATLLAFPGCKGLGDQCHHIIPRAAPHNGPDHVDNSLWVCAACHHDLHNNGIVKAKTVGYLALVEYHVDGVMPWQAGCLVPLDTPKESVR